MNLQASLHSHMEVIADLDVSVCNKYLVSSSQDGKIIVWDWRNCQKVDTINEHTANVNNVKFFTLRHTKESAAHTSDQSQY
jgi:WD40 repeat protein